MEFVSTIYASTDAFAKRESYSLTDQICRAAVSTPSNTAEGQARYSNRKFSRFLRHSRGSLTEVETQLPIAHSRHYLTDLQKEELLKRADERSRILNGLTNSIKERKASR